MFSLVIRLLLVTNYVFYDFFHCGFAENDKSRKAFFVIFSFSANQNGGNSQPALRKLRSLESENCHPESERPGESQQPPNLVSVQRIKRPEPRRPGTKLISVQRIKRPEQFSEAGILISVLEDNFRKTHF